MTKKIIAGLILITLSILSACSSNDLDLTTAEEDNRFCEENPTQADDYSDMIEVPNNIQASTSNVATPILFTEEDLPQILSATLPVNPATYNLASSFGPRLQSGDGSRYDFHRGIDLAGNEGDSVFAIASGTLYKAYKSGSSSFPGGGNVVVIRHDLKTPILFHEKKVTRVYSFYFHLKSFGPAATTYINTGKTSTMMAGDLVGLMGHTGKASFNHVHLEVRLQTPCSLEYQLENPSSSCSGYGYDPHINPLPLFADKLGDYQLSVNEVRDDLVVFDYSADHDHADINSLEIIMYSASNPSKILKLTEMDYNNRIGLDASTTSALDNPDLGDLLIAPSAFGDGPQDGQFYYSIDPTLKSIYPDLTIEATLYNATGDEVGFVKQQI